MIEDKSGFIRFVDSQPLADSTKKTYHTWVNRLDEHLPKPLSPKTVQSEKDVLRLANLMPKVFFVGGHFKDVKCMIRYYLKFNISKGVVAEQEAAEFAGEFSPADFTDARKKVWRSIALRRGQKRFRDQLLSAYHGRCCVTGTDAEEVLEAAHIKPYASAGINSVRNGLLLRSDIHVLFDLELLSINPASNSVFCSKLLRNVPPYSNLHGKKAMLPKNKTVCPDFDLLKHHYESTKG